MFAKLFCWFHLLKIQGVCPGSRVKGACAVCIAARLAVAVYCAPKLKYEVDRYLSDQS